MITTRIFFSETATGELAQGMDSIVREGIPKGAVQIYRGARNTLYDITVGGSRLCVKHFRHAKFPNNYIYTNFRRSKAQRSFEHARRLADLGFLTPEPLCYGENKKRGRLLDSFYFSRFEDLPNIRDWTKLPFDKELIAALGDEMVKLHRAGVLHKDFSPGNILYRRDSDGRFQFYYVDLNRMKFGVKSRKKLMGMFRSISLDPEQTRRLALSYASASGDDPQTVVTEALGALSRYLAVKRRHRWLKKLFKKTAKPK